MKTNYKTLEYWSRDTLNFDFSEKGLGLVSPPHFVYDLSRKMFLKLYPINWPNFIVWLPLLLQILGNMFITIVFYPGCDVIKFEINLILSSRFATWPNTEDNNLNILRLKRAFDVKLKVFFIIFKRFSVAKHCLRPESAPLMDQHLTLVFYM